LDDVTPRILGADSVRSAWDRFGQAAFREAELQALTGALGKDGQVIALGGLFKNSKSFGKNGLPFLSRLPVVGGLLFGNSTNTQQRTELLVILKAHVLRTLDDGRAVTEELRAKLRTLEPFRTKGTIP